MEFLNKSLEEVSEELRVNNELLNIDEGEHDWIEETIKNNIDNLVKSVNEELSFWSSKTININVKTKFEYSMTPQAKSSIIKNNEACIWINKGLIIHIYEMIYSKLKFENLISGEFDDEFENSIKDMIFISSIRLVTFHEIAHIFYGHGNLKLELMEELRKGIIKEEDYFLNLRTLEFQADAYSITRAVQFVEYQNLDNSVDSIKSFRFKILCMSVYFIMYMYREEMTLYKLSQNEHPYMKVRELSMLNIMTSFTKNKYVVDVIDMFDYLERNLNTQFKVEKELLNLFGEKNNYFDEQLQTLIDNYKILKYRIKKYSLLPIENIDY